MKNSTAMIFLVSAISASAAWPALAAEDMESRMAKLERLVNSQGMVDVLLRLESMQTELQRLRGEIEVQGHKLEEMKKRQRDLYLDVDRRLLELERRSLGAAAPVAALPQAGESDTSTVTAQPELQQPVDESSAAHQASPASSAEEQAAYEKAFDLLYTQRYDKAMEAFRDFLAKYPEGRYAHVAQYWLAEAGYGTGNYKQAIQDYQILIDKYPASPKRAEAMLKIGYSYYELKNYAEAEKKLQQLIDSYPGTTEAGQAKNQLKKIRLKKNR